MSLRVRNVKKYFGGVKALNGCTLSVDEKKITAIIGPNGSGKSTLFNAISKLIEIDSGAIRFGKRSIAKKKDFQVARLGISRTFQEVRLFRNLTIQEHLEIALSTTNENFFLGLFKKPISQKSKIKKILQQVHLDKPLTTYATNLSYGQRKLLDLAIAIAKPHSILLLDEPVAGVNPKLRRKIKEILRNLNKQGETILLIEHNMNFVMDLVDYIFVMDEGKVIAEGKPEQIQNSKKVLQAYLGE